MRSWDDVDSEEDFAGDELIDSSASHDEIETQSESLQSSYNDYWAMFQPANATIPQVVNRQGLDRVESVAVATFGVPRVTPPRASPVGDWALLTPTVEPRSVCNEVVYQGKTLAISGSRTITENMEVLSIRPKYGEPLLYKCSGAASLITVIGQKSFQKAHRIYGDFGE